MLSFSEHSCTVLVLCYQGYCLFPSLDQAAADRDEEVVGFSSHGDGGNNSIVWLKLNYYIYYETS